MVGYFGLKDAALGTDALVSHARLIATEKTGKAMRLDFPLLSLDQKRLTAAYARLYDAAKQGIEIPAALWLIDNFHLLEETAKQLENDERDEKGLPRMADGVFAGLPRVYRMAVEIVGHREGRVDEDIVIKFLEAFQQEAVLSMREVYSFKPMLQIALLKLSALEAIECLKTLQQRKHAEESAKKLLSADEKYIEQYFRRQAGFNSDEFVLNLSIQLRENGAEHLLCLLFDALSQRGETLEERARAAQREQIRNRMLMSNVINSLRTIASVDWDALFSLVCRVEIWLRKDPVYSLMDVPSRSYYKETVERIAQRAKVKEAAVARAALELSTKDYKLCGEVERQKRAHVGFYLFDGGLTELYTALKYEKKDLLEKNRLKFYIGSIAAIAMIALILPALAGASELVYLPIPILLGIACAWSIGQLLIHRICSSFPVRRIPRLELNEGIADSYRTAIVVPVLLNNPERVRELSEQIEAYYLGNRENNLFFVLLVDFPDAEAKELKGEKELCAYILSSIEVLNKRYVKEGENKFYAFVRKRTENTEGRWVGHERKRGALMDFNRMLLEGSTKPFIVKSGLLCGIRYVLTLDADTLLPMGAVKQLVGAMAHPLNLPEFGANNCVRRGHGMLAPRIELSAESASKTLFAHLFAMPAGLDSYSCAISETYHDVFGEGNFAGKGIYDVRTFMTALNGRVSDNTVLSHDLLEGCYTRAGFVSDIALYDGHPARYSSYVARSHRWMRGDWQLLTFALGNSSLSRLCRFKLLDNLRISLLEPSAFLLLLISPLLTGGWAWMLLAVLALFGHLLLDFFASLLRRVQDTRLKMTDLMSDFGINVRKAGFVLAVLPHRAVTAVDAIVRALYRSLISHKKVLEWATAAEVEKRNSGTVISLYRAMFVSPIAAFAAVAVAIYAHSMWSIVLAFAWAIGPLVAHFLSKPIKKETIEEDQAEFLKDIARRTWRFFEESADKITSLPPDNVQISPKKGAAHRTSPTNIGLSMAARFAAWKLGFLEDIEFLNKLEHEVATLEKLEKWHGHVLNWYDTRTLVPLCPRFVSAVDNGNLAACLLTLREGVKQVCINSALNERALSLSERLHALYEQMDFSLLYDAKLKLFYIGYEIEHDRFNQSHYDLLASEARILSFVAIAKGDADPIHWFRLARSLTNAQGKRLLVSWSGTMFEYLMPILFMHNTPDTLLGESAKSCVQAQIQFAGNMPWGVSESGYFAFDLDMNYQYRAFGIPNAGVKAARDDRVIAPYASVLALMVEPKLAVKNLQRLRDLGALGRYGFYEALDYTPERVSNGDFMLVSSYMAHHQGMSLLSLCNVLENNAIVEAFNSAPEVRAAALLTSERMPQKAVVLGEYNSALPKIPLAQFKELHISADVPAGAYPRSWVLLGGLSMLVFTDGRIISEYKGMRLYRDDVDPVRPNPGAVFLISDRTNQHVWNAAEGSTHFEAHKAVYLGEHNGIETRLSICTPPEQAAELRMLEIINRSEREAELDISAYIEVCLCTAEADIAHKSFQKLFIQAQSPREGTILFTRRPRHTEQPVHLCAQWHSDTGYVKLCSSRSDVIGRGNTIHNPAFLNHAPDSMVHSPIDPCAFFSQSFTIESGSSLKITLVLCVSEDQQDALDNAAEYSGEEPFERAVSLAWTAAQVRLKYLSLLPVQVNAFCAAAGIIAVNRPFDTAAIEKNTLTREGLWRFGISGDYPIVLMEIVNQRQVLSARQALQMQQFLRQCVRFDLVLLCLEEYGYEQPVFESLKGAVNAACAGGIAHVLSIVSMSEEERTLLRAFSALIISPDIPLYSQLFRSKRDYNALYGNGRQRDPLAGRVPKLEHWNGWGGFDGDEYVIRVREDHKTPLPWSNILANEFFGTLVTESGGGYTWALNSRENKLTSWSNDPITDKQGELCFLRDEKTGRAWSATPSPLPSGEYIVRHGFGYTRYESGGEGVYSHCTMFVDDSRKVKIIRLQFKNPLQTKRDLTAFFCAEWVLQSHRGPINPLVTSLVSDALIAKRGNDIAYVAAPGQDFGYTSDREEFFGIGGNLPAALSQKTLSGTVGAGYDCGALAVPFSLAAGEEKTITFLLGYEQDLDTIRTVCKDFARSEATEEALARVRETWNKRLGMLRVKTIDKAFDRMMNGWLLYQVWSSRLLSRTGFYQAGGAFGFRDQLQDVLALFESNAERAKEQILLAAAHQFEDGDVQHWWHPVSRGVRTHISDDLVFLPFVAAQYAASTGDTAIWDEQAPYLKNITIPEGQEEIYDSVPAGDYSDSIYNHCIKALKRAMRFGAHDLPLMGTGDWNDGMDSVGRYGKGESVWLGWFLLSTLHDMIPVCRLKEDNETTALFEETSAKLSAALEQHGWDGEWYRRAYFDDGTALGSVKSEECKIDGISQAWAAIAGGNKDRVKRAMSAVENMLLDRGNGLIRLLWPPLDKQLPHAGYIQGYIPGVRENGGQYTHGAVWTIIALLRMGEGNKAAEYFSLLNPIRHGDNPMVAERYKGEPYVMAGDVYANSEHAGRAGWTWYTGSAAWMYRAGLELLGIKKRGNTLEVVPSVSDWEEYEVEYRFGMALYVLHIRGNSAARSISLIDDGKRHEYTI